MIDFATLLIIGFLCLLIGFVFGSTYESLYGKAVKERDKYHRIILRMIPYLQRHLTNEFIFSELLHHERSTIQS